MQFRASRSSIGLVLALLLGAVGLSGCSKPWDPEEGAELTAAMIKACWPNPTVVACGQARKAVEAWEAGMPKWLQDGLGDAPDPQPDGKVEPRFDAPGDDDFVGWYLADPGRYVPSPTSEEENVCASRTDPKVLRYTERCGDALDFALAVTGTWCRAGGDHCMRIDAVFPPKETSATFDSRSGDCYTGGLMGSRLIYCPAGADLPVSGDGPLRDQQHGPNDPTRARLWPYSVLINNPTLYREADARSVVP